MQIALKDLIELNNTIARLHSIAEIVDDRPDCSNLAAELASCALQLDEFYDSYIEPMEICESGGDNGNH